MRPSWFELFRFNLLTVNDSKRFKEVTRAKVRTQHVACVQTSPISFVARGKGTRLATALRRRPFSACNKGNVWTQATQHATKVLLSLLVVGKLYQSIPKPHPAFPHPGIWLEFCSVQWGIWPKFRPAQSGIWLSCQIAGFRNSFRIQHVHVVHR